MGKLTDKVAKGVFWVLMEKFGVQAVHFVVTLVLARLLTPNDYGTVALLSIFISLSNLLVDCGFGKALLQKKNATVTMCHTRTVDLPGTCRNAEILVVAVGRAGIVDDTFVSPGQTVIDVGINVNAEGKLCGDADFEKVEPIVGAITPVPGGVGAVTTAVLCKHVIQAAEKTLK